MSFALFYWFALAIACFVVAWTGEREEKRCIAIYGVASIISAYVVSPLATRFKGPEWSVMAVDVCLLAPFLLSVLRSARHWPIWVTAFQVVSVVTNTVVVSHASRRAYAETLYILSFCILGTIVAGSWRSRAYRERDWQKARQRSGSPRRNDP